jgi:hypothetical protein
LGRWAIGSEGQRGQEEVDMIARGFNGS